MVWWVVGIGAAWLAAASVAALVVARSLKLVSKDDDLEEPNEGKIDLLPLSFQ